MEKKEKKRQFCLVLLMAGLFYGIAILCMSKEADEYSDRERRLLAQFPVLTLETMMDGSFMKEFETYSQDQFPFRENFLKLSETINRKTLGRLDHQGIYLLDRYLGKLDYPLQEQQLSHALEKIDEVYTRFLQGKEMEIYFAAIPDKNYYLAFQEGYPVLDYEKMFSTIQSQLPYAKFIDLTEELAREDFYYTDTHWRQERLLPVANKILMAMGEKQDIEYEQVKVKEDFLGVYGSQSALKHEGEELFCLYNELFKNYVVTAYGAGQPKEVKLYDQEALSHKDPYYFFLSGTQALLRIENPAQSRERELIVFRDSFGSSLIPLLAEDYGMITVIDLRYISSKLLGEYITFTNQDVLFLYSSLLLNNSLSMK